MFEIMAPVSRRKICDDLKVIHRGPVSVIEAAYDLTVDLLAGALHLMWHRLRRLNLPGARRAAQLVISLQELAAVLDEEGDAARAQMAVSTLVLTLPEWAYTALGEGTRDAVLAVADYAAWAIEPNTD